MPEHSGSRLPPITLADLAFGATGIVRGYLGPPSTRRRFVDMGIVPGARITRVRSAPLGDPSEYAVCGARLAVRDRDAATVVIEVAE